MRLIKVTLCAFLLAGFALSDADTNADQLSEQVRSLKSENREYLLRNEASKRATTIEKLQDTKGVSARASVANALMTKRIVDDLQKGNMLKSAPNFRSHILEQIGAGNADVATKTMLKIVSQAYSHNSYTVDMFMPFGKVSDGSRNAPGGTIAPLSPAAQPDPTSLTTLAKAANTINSVPDLSHLPFAMNFLVQIRNGQNGQFHCSGSLLSATVVLTARHCLYDLNTGKRLPEDQLQIRSVATGEIYHAVGGSAWIPNLSGDDSDYTSDADIATFKLAQPVSGNIIFGKVTLVASQQNMWVIMAGFGVTDQKNINLDGWNDGYISWPQLVEIGSLNSSDPTGALMKWVSTNAYASAQCLGDSGGPVFVVGAREPLIIGVLSTALKGNPDISSHCLANTGGAFVILAHPLVESQMCGQLQAAGTPCSTSVALTQNARSNDPTLTGIGIQ